MLRNIAGVMLILLPKVLACHRVCRGPLSLVPGLFVGGGACGGGGGNGGGGGGSVALGGGGVGGVGIDFLIPDYLTPRTGALQ